MVKPFMTRNNTNMRESIPVSERLALTLRYLATGRNFEDLKFSAVMSPASISIAIVETCEVLIYVLQDYEYILYIIYIHYILVYKGRSFFACMKIDILQQSYANCIG